MKTRTTYAPWVKCSRTRASPPAASTTTMRSPWPRGQTSDLNDAPLARRHHRAKTRLGYTLRQLDISAYRWTTPHGLGRLVTPTRICEFEPLGTIGELYLS